MPNDQTLADYDREWERYTDWCRGRALQPLSSTAPQTVALYLEAFATGALEDADTPTLGTLRRARAAIDHRFSAEGRAAPSDAPPVKRAWPVVGRRLSGKASRSGLITLEDTLSSDVLEMAAAQPLDHPLGRRDRALILLGAGAGLRPVEVLRLAVSDAEAKRGAGEVRVTTPEGTRVRLVSRKPYADPVEAFDGWLEILRPVRKKSRAPLFTAIHRHGAVGAKPMSRPALGVIVARAAELAGLPNASSITPGEVFVDHFAEPPTVNHG